jgi:hypothetical protein
MAVPFLVQGQKAHFPMFQETPPSSKRISDGGLAALSLDSVRSTQAITQSAFETTELRAKVFPGLALGPQLCG